MRVVSQVAVPEQWEQIDVADSGAHTSVWFDRDGDDDQANTTESELCPEIVDGGAGFGEVDRFNEIANILFVEESAVGGGHRFFIRVVEDPEEERLDERASIIS